VADWKECIWLLTRTKGVRFPPDGQNDSVAQLVEHLPFKQRVVGSCPTGITNKRIKMESPCIKICKLNEQNICIGCGRTKEDISGWRTMTDEEKSEAIKKAIEEVLKTKNASVA
jgi:uncharacterized protein